MRIAAIRQSMYTAGGKDCHVDRVLRAWTQAKPLDSGARRHQPENYLPLALRTVLPALQNELSGLARVRSEHPGEDGSSRLLVELTDGQTVESVLLPRDGMCVSTQIGCAVGCTFCMTGRDGLLRQVSSAEMVAQVVLGRARRKVSRVVFMGMGEPSHNMDNVLEAIDTLGTFAGIGHKNLVFSTVGDRRVFERLPKERVIPALALSLHSTHTALRAELLPKAPHIEPAELVELAEHYARTKFGNPRLGSDCCGSCRIVASQHNHPDATLAQARYGGPRTWPQSIGDCQQSQYLVAIRQRHHSFTGILQTTHNRISIDAQPGR